MVMFRIDGPGVPFECMQVYKKCLFGFRQISLTNIWLVSCQKALYFAGSANISIIAECGDWSGCWHNVCFLLVAITLFTVHTAYKSTIAHKTIAMHVCLIVSTSTDLWLEIVNFKRKYYTSLLHSCFAQLQFIFVFAFTNNNKGFLITILQDTFIFIIN